MNNPLNAHTAEAEAQTQVYSSIDLCTEELYI